MIDYKFPFGEPLHKVQQSDRSPKKTFVLGVYASAVHAKWIGPDGKQLVAALAVASEPSIFWTGEGVDDIISRINVPPKAGKLLRPSVAGMNGPSGRALDELFLKPLNLDRNNTWLCDLLPESRVNPQQRKAIESKYLKYVKECGLPEPTIPDFSASEIGTEGRTQEILEEIKESCADTLVLLGDLPIKHFLKYVDPDAPASLAEFGGTPETYGKSRRFTIGGREMDVIALCHPRQADSLGISSKKWELLHTGWMKA